MAEGINPYNAAEEAALTPINDYAAAADDKARVQLLIDTIEPEYTTTYRGELGDMYAGAHKQLLVELRALKAAVV